MASEKIDDAFHEGDREEVPRYIVVHASPGKARSILDGNGGNRAIFRELQERLNTVEETSTGARLKSDSVRADLKLVSLGFLAFLQ